MIARISEIIYEWMGWCPNTMALPQPSSVLTVPAPMVIGAGPDGGSGGMDRISQGLRLALGSITILLKNTSLLLFPVLAGFTILFGGLLFNLFWMLIWTPLSRTATDLLIQDYYGYGPALVQHNFIRDTADLLDTSVFTFTFSLFLTFCFALLLAALITSVTASLEKRPITLRAGLSLAWGHARSLLGYSALIAIIATGEMFLFNVITRRETVFMTPDGPGSSVYNSATVPLLIPGLPSLEIPVPFIRLVISLVLLLVTMFVIPVLLFEKKGIIASLLKSVSLLRKIWRESLGFAVMAGLALSAMAVTFEVPWDSTPGTHLLLLLIWGLTTITATIAAILLIGLYQYADTGRIPDAFMDHSPDEKTVWR